MGVDADIGVETVHIAPSRTRCLGNTSGFFRHGYATFAEYHCFKGPCGRTGFIRRVSNCDIRTILWNAEAQLTGASVYYPCCCAGDFEKENISILSEPLWDFAWNVIRLGQIQHVSDKGDKGESARVR